MTDRKKDKRRFRRYGKRASCEVSVNGKPYRAETVDYSVEGIGLKVEDTPPVGIGDVLGIKSGHPGASADGEVAWSAKGKNFTRLGLRRRGMLAGSLQDFSFADVILGLHRSGKTGVLLVVKAPLRKSVYLDGGELVFAVSNDPIDRLGEVLVSEGRITNEQYAQAEKLSEKTGKRLGAVLVELGYLDAKSLFQEVTKGVERIIEGIFSYKGGEFLFKEGPLPTREVIKLSLSVASIIYRGMKKIEDREHIRRMAPPLDAALGFSPDPLHLFQDVEIEAADKRLLGLIKGKITVKELVRKSGMGEADALRAICALLATRMLDVFEADEEAADISPEAVVEETGKKKDYEEVAAKILKLYDEHKGLGYYGVLGVKQADDRTTIKRAFYKMAKEFHPDKHFHLPEDMKDKLNTVFTYITTAYTTLTNHEARGQYDSALRDKGREQATNKEIAEQRFAAGMREFDMKNYADAAQFFGAAAYLNDSEAKYHFNLGVALARDGKYKEAERAISRAVRIEPFKASYLAEAGHIYLGLNLPKRARNNFEKAIKAEPNNRRALEGMAKLPPEPPVA